LNLYAYFNLKALQKLNKWHTQIPTRGIANLPYACAQLYHPGSYTISVFYLLQAGKLFFFLIIGQAGKLDIYLEQGRTCYLFIFEKNI